MESANDGRTSFGKMVQTWIHPRMITMLFLGFSAGVPILLIFSTLSVWLREAGVSRSAVTFFSWAALGYSFKFIWAPIIDRMPLPFLTRKLGRRRGWLIVSQLLVITAILWMGSTDPSAGSNSLTLMAVATVLLGFSSATQDIVIDAYRIECVDESYQALLSSMYIAGYRIGMLVAGAGSLVLASYFGTTSDNYSYTAWLYTYLAMAICMLIGVVTTLVIPEPVHQRTISREYTTREYARFLSVFLTGASLFGLTFFFSAPVFAHIKEMAVRVVSLNDNLIGFCIQVSRFFISVGVSAAGVRLITLTGFVDRKMVAETYVAPVIDFFDRYKVKTALLLLLLVGFYRLSDVVLGVVANVFYVDLGFDKNTIAGITKTFGLFMTLAGGFLGGILTLRYGVYTILFVGALLSAATNILFMLLAQAGPDTFFLTLVIAADNLSAGLANTAFVAFLSSLTNISFTAVQYAIFSSLMTLFPKLIGGYSGTVVTSLGYESFFLLTAVMGIPVLFIVWKAKKMTAKK